MQLSFHLLFKTIYIRIAAEIIFLIPENKNLIIYLCFQWSINFP